MCVEKMCLIYKFLNFEHLKISKNFITKNKKKDIQHHRPCSCFEDYKLSGQSRKYIETMFHCRRRYHHHHHLNIPFPD